MQFLICCCCYRAFAQQNVKGFMQEVGIVTGIQLKMELRNLTNYLFKQSQ